MSKPKERWWDYVRNILFAYQDMSRSPFRSGMEDRECAAVAQAMKESDTVTQALVQLVYFDHSHTLRGAAALHGVSFGAACRMQGDYFRLVWRCLDLLHLGTKPELEPLRTHNNFVASESTIISPARPVEQRGNSENLTP